MCSLFLTCLLSLTPPTPAAETSVSPPPTTGETTTSPPLVAEARSEAPSEERNRWRAVGSLGTPGILSGGVELNLHRRVDIAAEISLMAALGGTIWDQARMTVHAVRWSWGSVFVGGLGVVGMVMGAVEKGEKDDSGPIYGGGPIGGMQVLIEPRRLVTVDLTGGLLWGHWDGLPGARGHQFPVVLARVGWSR